MALVGGVGVLASTGSAAAEITLNTNAVSARNPDGEITKVFLTPEGGVEWHNFDQTVNRIGVEIESRVTKKDGTALTGWRTALDRTWGLGGESGMSNDGLNVGPVLGQVNLYGGDPSDEQMGGDTNYFDVSADGETVRRRVEIRFTVELLHGDTLADPRDEARIVEEAAFFADSTNVEASSGVTVTAGEGMK